VSIQGKVIFVFGLLFSGFLSNILFAADTVLVNLYIHDFRINNVVVDSFGEVYFSDRNGVFRYKEGKAKLYDPSYKEVLFIEKGQLFYLEDLKQYHDKITQYLNSQPLEWLKFLNIQDSDTQITVGVHGRKVFVSYKNLLYEFIVQPNFERHLSGISVRRILKKGDDLFVGTYKGGFLGDSLLTPKVMDGFIFDNGNEVIFGGGRNIFKLKSSSEKSLVANFISEDELMCLLPYEFWDFTELMIHENFYYIATDAGLYIYDSRTDNLTYLFEGTTIHNFVKLAPNYYAVCTETGIFLGNYKKGFTHVEIGNNGNPNDLFLVGDKMYLTTSTGFFEVKNRQTTKWKIQPRIFYNSSEFEFYQMELGLDGHIWISSENGLYRYNPLNQSYNYFYQGYEFNKRASFNAGKILFFGGVFGLIEVDMEGVILEDAKYLTNYNYSGEPLNSKKWLSFVFVGLLGLGIFLLMYYLYQNKLQDINEFDGIVSNPNKIKDNDEIVKINDPLYILKQCKAIINKNISSVTVGKLAEELNLSERTLSRKLEIVGKTPGELIREARIEIIKSHLSENPDTSPESLALITGYSLNHILNLIREL
jgi:AraC-like DNA-binding protein